VCGCVGLFFLLAWIFVLGILVGRGFLPQGVRTLEDLKTPISKLQHMVGKKTPSDLEEIKKLEKNPKFVFYDELSNKKKVAADENRLTPHNKKVKKVPNSKIHEPRTKARTDFPEGHGTTSDPLSSSTGRYTLQLASLESQSQAVRFTSKLIDRGYPAYFYELVINGKIYYRVRCGRFETRKKAMEFNQMIYDKEKIKGYVTRREEEK
jgi:septal ring-binding cell division protein DamX